MHFHLRGPKDIRCLFVKQPHPGHSFTHNFSNLRKLRFFFKVYGIVPFSNKFLLLCFALKQIVGINENSGD
jgi:hypothetical protein